MDRPGPPGDGDRRTSPLNDVCLERTIELDNVRLSVRDFPGIDGPLVHIPDPLCTSSVVDRFAAAFAPRYRVLSITPRADQPYQVHVTDIAGALAQFGFVHTLVVAEGLACPSALLLAAWYSERVGCLALVDAMFEVGNDEHLTARSLRECPLDLSAIRPSVKCPVIELAGASPSLIGQLEKLLGDRPLP